MKEGVVSKLNPYAEAYIPLSKRGVEKEKGEMMKKEDEVAVDEEFEMDLDFIQMAFPSLSHHSIAQLYFANNADFEATVQILTQLQYESSENLPDTLDIGDASEPGSSIAECSSVKLKNVSAEVGAAASDSTASAKVVITRLK